MKAKAVIVSVFALVLAPAAISGEQYRLCTEAAVDGSAPTQQVHTVTREVDVTN